MAGYHHAHGKQDMRTEIIAPHSSLYSGPFGRLFRHLPPYSPPRNTDKEKEEYLRELAARMIETSGKSQTAFDNNRIPAGYTYFGQFVDHDITFDPTSSLQRRNDPNRLQNFRTPRFDLDNIYGSGPADEPFQYDPNDPAKLLIGPLLKAETFSIAGTEVSVFIPDSEATEDDLPRNLHGTALIGDPRNDENIFVSQLQLAFLKFHNAVVDHVRNEGRVHESSVFAEAQRLTRWHYQWVVIKDFLERICGDDDLIEDLLPDTDKGCPRRARLCYYKYRNDSYMPVEFSVAAYRFGHSMVRPAYQLNKLVGRDPNLPIFTVDPDADPLTHFGGFRPLPRFWTIQWDLFLEINCSDPQKSRRIDRFLSKPLGKLPDNIDAINRSLAFLNLVRSWRMGLPSGQRVAKAMCITEDILEPFEDFEDPLWLYILREAEEHGDGKHLGPVGARIVAEVFIGLLAGDPLSFLNIEPCWKPIFPSEGSDFQLRDILRFAGVALTEDDLSF